MSATPAIGGVRRLTVPTSPTAGTCTWATRKSTVAVKVRSTWRVFVAWRT